MSRTLLLLFICASSALLAQACTGADGESGVPQRCQGFDLTGRTYEHSACRVFKGRLRLPPQKQLALPGRPFQVIALGFQRLAGAPVRVDGGVVDGGAPAPATDQVAPRIFYGAPFDAIEGAGYRPNLPFSVVVPCEVSVNLLLQIPSTSGDRQPGAQVAQMRFAPAGGETGLTTLVPRQEAGGCSGQAAQLDLGLVDLELARRGDLRSGSITLGKGNSVSPLGLVPAPEGTTTEKDADGDGILDSQQTFAALPDTFTPGLADDGKPHPDGIPDLFQPF